MKNFISIDNLDLKSSSSINSFIKATSEIKECLITNVLQENNNIWLSGDFLPQEIVLNFRNIKLKENPKKLTAIGIYCWNKYPTNPKIIEVLISKDKEINFISLGHFDLSYKAGRQLIYLDDENDIELEEILSSIDFNDLIIKLIIKETFGGKHTYINNLYLYDKIDTNNINISNNGINNNQNNINNNTDDIATNNNNENHDNINDINNDYLLAHENENDISENNDNNVNKMNFIENDNKNENNELNKFENQENNNNIVSNGNENIEQDIIENAENISNINSNGDNGSQNVNFEQDNYYNKQIPIKRITEAKTPNIRKEYSNKGERPIISNSLINRNINTNVRQYNNKNLLEFENINRDINEMQYNKMSSSDKLNNLLNEFKNYRENQEYMMNNYESRVRLLENKCFELKNNLKKMNATMNTIIDSQYSQNQASNDYLLRECHNMVNEAIVNILSNMGKSFSSYNPTNYGNNNFYMNRNRNLNNNRNFYNNYGNNQNNFLNNTNNYIPRENFMNRETEYDDLENAINNEDNINNKNFYDVNDYGNENESDKINFNNNHDEEYLEREISNNKEEEQFNINNEINKKNENNNDNLIINNNNTIKLNNNIKNLNLNTDISKKQNINDFHTDGFIPYEEKTKANLNKKINRNDINKYINNANNNINKNQNNYYNNNLENNNLNYNTLIKSKSNSNLIKKEKNKNLNKKKDIDNSYQIYTEKRKSRKNLIPETKFNKTNIKNLNNDLSSDNSSDDIKINTKITENILKPTLEKFESYMNVNNFGKSQNVYTNNAFNKKKEIFGDNLDTEKSQNKMKKEK